MTLALQRPFSHNRTGKVKHFRNFRNGLQSKWLWERDRLGRTCRRLADGFPSFPSVDVSPNLWSEICGGRAQHPPAASRSAPPPPQNQISHSEKFGNPLSLNDPASSFCILHSAFCISLPLAGTARRAPAEGHHGDPGWPLRGPRIRVANHFPPPAFYILPSTFEPRPNCTGVNYFARILF